MAFDLENGMNVFFRFSSKVFPCKPALLLVALLLCAAARADGLYQVELVVFSRDGAAGEERSRNDYNLRYPERIQRLSPYQEGDSAPFQLLPADALQLKREATAIGQRRNMRVLFHGAWQQEIGSAGQTPSIFIDGGQAYGQHHELEGFITLAADKLLHVDTQLWMTRFASGPGIAATAPPVLPAVPFAAADAGMTDTNLLPAQLYVLQNQRRLRSGELHYQDHPRFGTLLLITPASGATAQQ